MPTASPRAGAAGATGAPTFLNDAVVAPDGSVYITDSQRPVLYRIGPDDYATDGVETLAVFLDFTGTALQYVPTGFNVNGIAATPDGRYLVLAQSNTGQLYRVERGRPAGVSRSTSGGASVSGDGLVLRGRTLYAVERQRSGGATVVEIRLSGDLGSGTVLSRTTDPIVRRPDDRGDRPRAAAGGEQPVRRARGVARPVHRLEHPGALAALPAGRRRVGSGPAATPATPPSC